MVQTPVRFMFIRAMLQKMNLLGEKRGGGLGIRLAISGKLLDAHCFEPAAGPSEVICFPSPASAPTHSWL